MHTLPIVFATFVRISATDTTSLPEFLETFSAHCDRVLICCVDDAWLNRQFMGTTFSHAVPSERLFDTYRAIFAFFELDVAPVAGTSLCVVYRSRSRCGSWRARGPPERGRHRYTVVGLGKGATLELAWPLGALADAKYRRTALLEKSRARLLHTLRGVSADGRRRAAMLLGELGPMDMTTRRALLDTIAVDEDPKVRDAARKALRTG